MEVEKLVPAVFVPDPDFDHQLRLYRLNRLHLLLNLLLKVRVLLNYAVHLCHDTMLFHLFSLFGVLAMKMLLRLPVIVVVAALHYFRIRPLVRTSFVSPARVNHT